jgi:uncharacterized protein YbjQ (UPF0145 family)
MPIFANKPPGDAAAWEPQAADGRLAHTAGADPSGVFTSDLSVSEYVLLGEAGFEPLGFVVGSSIYHIGLQAGKWSQNQGLQILTQAMYSARELAMARMQAETAQAGSAGIVGVTVEVNNHVWGEHATEFLATGTAIRRLGDEHRLPETSPKPTFTLGLDS